MKKSDLKVGDVVKTREGRYFVILPNPFSLDGLGTFSAAGCQCYLSQYTDDLLEKTRETHDIVAVYKSSVPHNRISFNLIKGIMTCNIDKIVKEIIWDWERPEPVKEMTMEELEEHFGCKVKIINAEQ